MSSESTKYSKWGLPGGNIEPLKFKLYVVGASPNSVRAISNLTHFCETLLNVPYSLEIIDVHQQPSMARREQIIALPLLIKVEPGPERRLIGDMSVIEKIIKGLGLVPALK